MDCRKGSEFLRDLKAEGSRPGQDSSTTLDGLPDDGTFH